MDFESPDVEKDFPGLYASESGRKSNESDFSDGGEHEKPSKKDLLGRRKDKKEKKDRGYAALEGESSPEEDTDTKSPSKSKKTKSFKFPTKSKEKREKSRDKEKVLEEATKHKESNEKEKKKEKEKEKERKEKEKREKLKEKDKEKEEKAKFKLESKEKLKDEKKEKVKDKDKEKVKEKDKEKVKEKEKEKIKDKDKDKKDKKLTKVPSTVTSGVPFEEIFTLGVALPIFGVPLQQSIERSRCHDDTRLPLVVRDSIDFLQAHGLKSPQIYRAEADKIKLQQLRKLFTDRGATFPYHWDVPVACAMLKSFIRFIIELRKLFKGRGATFPYHWDVPVACAMLKSFMSELPDSILTQELHGQFEQATAIAEPQREANIARLIASLPKGNHTLLGWLMRHFECVVANEQFNHANIQTIATAMGPALNMSYNLLSYLIANAEKLFPDVHLTKYVPPWSSLPAEFPVSRQELQLELAKQESLLAQVHAEMHAGVTCPARDQQLWEAQRIVTQLKRKLRSVQKTTDPSSLPPQPSLDEKPDEEPMRKDSQPNEPITIQAEVEVNTPITTADAFADKFQDVKNELPKQDAPFEAEFEDNFDFKPETTLNFKPETSLNFKPETTLNFKPEATLNFIPEAALNFKPETILNFNPETIEVATEDPPPAEPVIDKPKFTEKELRVLRLELENAEYLQLKSLLQAKINSEQFEIVKLRSHIALKNKLEQEKGTQNTKDIKENPTPEDQELKQRLIKENALLEQKRLNLVNQIFQERVACIQLKIELAMKEILSKS